MTKIVSTIDDSIKNRIDYTVNHLYESAMKNLHFEILFEY